MLLCKGGRFRIEGEPRQIWTLYEGDEAVERNVDPVVLFRCFIARIEHSYWRSVKPMLVRAGYDPLFGTWGEYDPSDEDPTDPISAGILRERDRLMTH